MGSPIQKIFQRGGKKERTVNRLIILLPYLFLFVLFYQLLIDFPAKAPKIYAITIILFVLSELLCNVKQKRKPFLLIIAIQVIIETLSQIEGLSAFHIHIPILTITAFFVNFKTILIILLLQPFLHIRELFMGEYQGVLIFIGVAYLTTLAVSLYIKSLKKKIATYKNSFNKLHSEAKELTDTAKSFSNDTLMSQFLAYVQEVEKDILDLLIIAERSLAADSINLFLNEKGELSFKLSSNRNNLKATGEGLIYSAFQKKMPLLSNLESTRDDIKLGYLSREKIASFLAAPVMELSTPLGILCAESSRYRAFDQQDIDLMEFYASEIAKVLKRQRIYSQIQLDYKGLQILRTESCHLAKLLEISEISRRVVNSAEKVSNATAVLLFKKVGKYDIILKGKVQSVRSLKGTLLQIAVDNREPLYRVDISKDEIKKFPFDVKGIRSVLVIPMFHEDKVAAILTVFSEKRDAFNPYLIELLKVLVDQASLSISNALLHEEIRMMAFTDGLTGLFNHRRFQEKLAEEFKRSERFNEPISMILADIDHFKKVNDAYGHPVGDTVLKSFSGIIKKTIREIDIPARYGGEEFAILVVRADAKGTKNIAERIRKNVKEYEFRTDEQRFHVSVSIGIASYPSDASTKEELVEKADQALYRAKESGRDRTVLYRALRMD